MRLTSRAWELSTFGSLWAQAVNCPGIPDTHLEAQLHPIVRECEKARHGRSPCRLPGASTTVAMTGEQSANRPGGGGRRSGAGRRRHRGSRRSGGRGPGRRTRISLPSRLSRHVLMTTLKNPAGAGRGNRWPVEIGGGTAPGGIEDVNGAGMVPCLHIHTFSITLPVECINV
jgi:hypothetical protein